MDSVPNDPFEIRPAAAALLASAGMQGEFDLQPLVGGRNNRVYEIRAARSQAALKWYFWQSQDSRDRLDSEYRFCDFCWNNGISAVPRPLAVDWSKRLGLFEWIQGHRLAAGEVSQRHVVAAVDFVRQLNRCRSQELAAQLPAAAEACFGVTDHFDCVDRRIARLERMEPSGELHRAADAFVQTKLIPSWRQVRSLAERELAGHQPQLGVEDRCLSPSDFGFHNALVTSEGVRFLDFEYAGWDDPAKLVCDFFCQIECPVPLAHWAAVVDGLLPIAAGSDSFRRRCCSLMPVYRIKWCCIVLNEFLPEHGARRQFSAADNLSQEQLAAQLRKAEQILATPGARLQAPGSRLRIPDSGGI